LKLGGVVVDLAFGTLVPVSTNDARVIVLILSIFIGLLRFCAWVIFQAVVLYSFGSQLICASMACTLSVSLSHWHMNP
jgi:hypothetical protein